MDDLTFLLGVLMNIGCSDLLLGILVRSIGDVRTLMMDEAHASRYLVHSGADKTYYDLRDMYGGHVWRRILLPMLPRSSSGYDTNWVIVDRLTKIVWEVLLRGLVDIAEALGTQLNMRYDLSSSNGTEANKYLANTNLHVHLEEIKVDNTLRFVEEPVEIIDREVKSLKCSRILIVKSIGTRSEVMRIS
ncbi:hypothetical protein Tco_1094775 [Tanacetum coccineum]|uniref:Uncharacterized protein n=1 Tax=Tanacetum coccineum TaxID=301880 RepID=A0ABQ5IGL0_9ASTR